MRSLCRSYYSLLGRSESIITRVCADILRLSQSINCIIIIKKAMFLNNPQDQDIVEVFDARVAKDKDKVSYRTLNNNGASRIFDSSLKNYVVQMRGGNSNKMIIPKDNKDGLFLVQQYLILQLQPLQNLSLQLFVSDNSKTYRRIVVSPCCQKPEVKLFFARVPSGLANSQWHHVCIDLWSFMSVFAGQTYRALEQIYLGGAFRLRRIFTSKYPVHNNIQSQKSVRQSLHRQFAFLPSVNFSLKSYTCNDFFTEATCGMLQEESTLDQCNHDYKNGANIKRFSVPKKHNGHQSSRSKAKPLTNHSEVCPKSIRDTKTQAMSRSKTPASTTATTKVLNRNCLYRLPLLKKSTASTHAPSTADPKSVMGSLENHSSFIDETIQRRLERVVVNKWRIPKVPKNMCSSSKSKSIEVNKTVKTSQFNKKTKLPALPSNKVTLQKSIYSDSEYFQMSQKFSTITDQRFFRHRIEAHTTSKGTREFQRLEESMNEEIEEAIEIESIAAQEQMENHPDQINPVKQEIRKVQFNKTQVCEAVGFSSIHCQEFLREAQRPYTPPLNIQPETSDQARSCVPKQVGSELQLVFDPVLNCYYDFKTHTYYELRL